MACVREPISERIRSGTCVSLLRPFSSVFYECGGVAGCVVETFSVNTLAMHAVLFLGWDACVVVYGEPNAFISAPQTLSPKLVLEEVL